MTSTSSRQPKRSYDKPVALTEQEYKVLKTLSGTDEECYNYAYLEGDTGLSRKWLQPIIAKLRQLGYVEYWRGLMTDDGEVAGSGFCRSRAGNEIVYAEEDRIYAELRANTTPKSKLAKRPTNTTKDSQ